MLLSLDKSTSLGRGIMLSQKQSKARLCLQIISRAKCKLVQEACWYSTVNQPIASLTFYNRLLH